MAITLFIKNIDTEVNTWVNHEFQPNEEWEVPSSRLEAARNDVLFLQDLANGKASISNGSSYFSDFSLASKYLFGGITELTNIDITSSEKALKVTPTKLEGSSTLKISHNYCDKTTWYTESVEVTSETLSVSGAGNLVFMSLHEDWIDLTHGKVPYEARIAADYSPVISVDDVPLTGDAASGFTINYEEGSVTFLSEQTGTVKAHYHYADGSGWFIEPDPGKILKIIGTEVKFTEDSVIDMDHAIIFQLYIFGGTVPYGEPTIYNNLEDIIKCSMGESYVIPAFGVMPKKVIVLPFDYITSKDLPSSLGAVIKIKLAEDTPVEGTFGIVSAHCISVNE